MSPARCSKSPAVSCWSTGSSDIERQWEMNKGESRHQDRHDGSLLAQRPGSQPHAAPQPFVAGTTCLDAGSRRRRQGRQIRRRCASARRCLRCDLRRRDDDPPATCAIAPRPARSGAVGACLSARAPRCGAMSPTSTCRARDRARRRTAGRPSPPEGDDPARPHVSMSSGWSWMADERTCAHRRHGGACMAAKLTQ